MNQNVTPEQVAAARRETHRAHRAAVDAYAYARRAPEQFRAGLNLAANDLCDIAFRAQKRYEALLATQAREAVQDADLVIQQASARSAG